MNSYIKSILGRFTTGEILQIAAQSDQTELTRLLSTLSPDPDANEAAELNDAILHYEISDEDIVAFAIERRQKTEEADRSPRCLPETVQVFGLRSVATYLKESPEMILRVYIDEAALDFPEIRYTLLKAKQLSRDCVIVRNNSDSPFSFYGIGLELKVITQELSSDRPHILMENVRSGSNLGYVVSAAKAFGYNDVAIIDPERKFFQSITLYIARICIYCMRIQFFDSIEQYSYAFPKHKLYLFMPQAKDTLEQAKQEHPALYTLAFGNESLGLSEDSIKYGTAVSIPMKGGAESLNVDVAAGIAMYEFIK